ncbi:hypothetical protein [Bacillus sp. FJAT-29790]|uniref:hypothetical protein n=1 Tax=Bacillus sp. FJAT-29790 TaxID=1895002 RepID=UPI0020B21F69|nr:hypothetical protein [Bacillus sp. FJAT-29790]
MSKKILILSEAIGNGHTKAAEGLMQGISHLAPSTHVSNSRGRTDTSSFYLKAASELLSQNGYHFSYIMEKIVSL